MTLQTTDAQSHGERPMNLALCASVLPWFNLKLGRA
jgi:hypothetical protein